MELAVVEDSRLPIRSTGLASGMRSQSVNQQNGLAAMRALDLMGGTLALWILTSGFLALPLDRATVLVPLADIAPELLHPILLKRISELVETVDRSGVRPSPTR